MTETRPLRALAEVALGRQRSPATDQGPHMVRYLRAVNVKDGHLELGDVKEMNFTPAEQRVFRLERGDVLVSEGSGSLASVGASAVWSGEVDGPICFQNTLLRLRARPNTDRRFLAWWCRHAFADGLFASVATGANIFHVSAERVRSLPVMSPSLERQRGIADFLDSETLDVDSLISRRGATVSLGDERLAATINDKLVGCGPETPLRYAVRYREGPGIMAADFRREGVPLLRIGNLQGRRVVLEGCNYVESDEVDRRWRQFRVQVGDYLLSGSATMGEVSIVDDPHLEGAIPYTGLIILRPVSAEIHMPYVAAFLRAPMFFDQVERLKTGVGLQHFGPMHLAQIRLPLPALAEQRRIADEVDAASVDHDRARSAFMRQIALLLERRQALITAAVTGQLDIPGVAA